MNKKIYGNTYKEVLRKVIRLIDDYFLELISLEVKKENDVYVADVKYGLGIKR